VLLHYGVVRRKCAPYCLPTCWHPPWPPSRPLVRCRRAEAHPPTLPSTPPVCRRARGSVSVIRRVDTVPTAAFECLSAGLSGGSSAACAPAQGAAIVPAEQRRRQPDLPRSWSSVAPPGAPCAGGGGRRCGGRTTPWPRRPPPYVDEADGLSPAPRAQGSGIVAAASWPGGLRTDTRSRAGGESAPSLPPPRRGSARSRAPTMQPPTVRAVAHSPAMGGAASGEPAWRRGARVRAAAG